ncbi:excalibur calcium-binding domain-containing protein [Haemophilus paracuniculus]|uniref:excalibur calcium-binding domain-containing protein n=1 Tax=Haemophilus paracuniculus TaxID=734 RepID=UPI001FE7FAFF|nr:excalibur calcium-binding domain-containing protein [Haemophilus paracuniculus]
MYRKENTNSVYSTTSSYRKSSNPSKKAAKPQNSNLKCGGKRYCSDMNSCAEAKFYLRQCGLRRLDRDGDGVPCESLCG